MTDVDYDIAGCDYVSSDRALAELLIYDSDISVRQRRIRRRTPPGATSTAITQMSSTETEKRPTPTPPFRPPVAAPARHAAAPVSSASPARRRSCRPPAVAE